VRPLAFVAIRTTEPDEDEIEEIAAVRVDPRSLEVEQELCLEVVPEFVGHAVPDDASGEAFLERALERLQPVLSGAVLAGHELSGQLAQLHAAWQEHGHRPEDLGEQALDTATLSWPLLATSEVPSLSLEAVCDELGIERAEPLTALERARCSLEIARRLLPGQQDEARLRELRGHERAIARTLLARLRGGREEHGPWKTEDGRVHAREALLEVLDCLHYVAAELARLERRQRVDGLRTRRVYVCHPFRDDPARNAERVRDLCAALIAEGCLPVAPHLWLPRLVDDEVDRELAMRLCLELVDDCDEMRVYGTEVTRGMRQEIERAEARGLKVAFDDPLGGELAETAREAR